MKVVYRFLNVSLPRCTSPNYLPPSITLIFHQIVTNLGLESGYKAGPITIPRHNTDIALTTRMHQCCHEYHKKNDQDSYLICHLILHHLERRIPEKSIRFWDLFIWIPIWLHVSDESITNTNFHYTGKNQTEFYGFGFP